MTPWFIYVDTIRVILSLSAASSQFIQFQPSKPPMLGIPTVTALAVAFLGCGSTSDPAAACGSLHLERISTHWDIPQKEVPQNRPKIHYLAIFWYWDPSDVGTMTQIPMASLRSKPLVELFLQAVSVVMEPPPIPYGSSVWSPPRNDHFSIHCQHQCQHVSTGLTGFHSSNWGDIMPQPAWWSCGEKNHKVGLLVCMYYVA